MRTSHSALRARTGRVAGAIVAFGALWVGLVLIPSTALASDAARPNPIPAPASGCYIGACVASGAPGLAPFDQQAGKRHAFFLKFVEVGERAFSEGGESSVDQFCQSCYAAGALPYLTLQPSHATPSSLFTSADAAWMEQFSKDVGELKRPVFIRFAHEMNGNWYPWGWQHVSPSVYIQGFRQVADDFSRNAPQAAMVWAPSQNWGNNCDPLYSEWYPGDDCVDWVGLTSYQWSYSGIDANQFDDSIEYGQAPESDFYSTFAVGHDKPMMISETGCRDDSGGYYDNLWSRGTQDEVGTYGTGVGQGAQNWWIRQVYRVGSDDHAVNVRFPRIQAVCWFAEGDFDFGGTDPLAHSTGFSAYSQAISDPYWLSYTAPSASGAPPVSTISGLEPGWVRHDVTFIIAAADADSPSGISTYYALNGAPPVAYAGPVTVSAEGATTVTYYSVDAAGNAETRQSATIRIDKTGPRLALDAAATYSGSATIGASASDSVSGLDHVEFSLDGGPWARGTQVSASSLGPHTIAARAFDVAGNETDLSAGFTILAALPAAYVSTPVAPSSMSKTKSYSVYGYLKPRHTAGTYPVRVYEWRYVSGQWKSYGYVNARASDYSTYTKYSVSIRLATAGQWRIRAFAPSDGGQTEAWSSGYATMTVR